MNAIIKAVEAAKAIIASFNKPVDSTELVAELKKLSKEQLIARVLQHELKPEKPAKVEDIAYAILESPDCAWLTYDAIASLIQSEVAGAKTSSGSLAWYFSHSAEKGRNAIARKSAKAINAELMASIGQ